MCPRFLLDRSCPTLVAESQASPTGIPAQQSANPPRHHLLWGLPRDVPRWPSCPCSLASAPTEGEQKKHRISMLPPILPKAEKKRFESARRPLRLFPEAIRHCGLPLDRLTGGLVFLPVALRLRRRPARAARFHAAIRAYWPDLRADDLAPDYAGVRPKIVGPGEGDADFLIHGAQDHGVRGLVALYGVESPGITSALALGAHVARMIESDARA